MPAGNLLLVLNLTGRHRAMTVTTRRLKAFPHNRFFMHPESINLVSVEKLGWDLSLSLESDQSCIHKMYPLFLSGYCEIPPRSLIRSFDGWRITPKSGEYFV